MNIHSNGDTLTITGLDRLTSVNARYFKERALATLEDRHAVVDLDLSTTRFLDSEGLGALIAVKRRVAARDGRLRLLHPIPFVQQLLELLRLDQVFEVVRN